MSEDFRLGPSKNDFLDLYRALRPEATREEFESEWLKFLTLKGMHVASKQVQ